MCRRHGISSATFFKWKSKLGGLEVSDARRLRQLEQENTRLKKLSADSMLDDAVFNEISAKRLWHPVSDGGRWLTADAFEVSERRACAVPGLDRTMLRHVSRRPDDSEARERLRDLASHGRRFGYRRLHWLLRGKDGR